MTKNESVKRKSGSESEKQVRIQSKSSKPIFFIKTIVRMIQRYAPPGTRTTPNASRLLRLILEKKAVDFASKALAASKVRKGNKNQRVRVMNRDVDLVLSVMGKKNE
jgi:histone H3/H4